MPTRQPHEYSDKTFSMLEYRTDVRLDGHGDARLGPARDPEDGRRAHRLDGIIHGCDERLHIRRLRAAGLRHRRQGQHDRDRPQ